MKTLSIFIFLLISSNAWAQYNFATEEICSNLDEFTALTKKDIAKLEVEVNNYLKDLLKDSSAILKGFEYVPKGTLHQSFLTSFAECYLQGRYVKKDPERAKVYLSIAEKMGNKGAAHMLASLRLFQSKDNIEQRLGFSYLESEYEEGSAYSAGKLGWAYQRGLGVEPNLLKAIELYEYAALRGMTYWQFLLAHAYEKGYLGFEVDEEKAKYWFILEPKVHSAKYECWVANYYRDGTFPTNNMMLNFYQAKCEDANKSIKQTPKSGAANE